MPKCSLQRMTNNVRCTFSGAIPHMWLQLVLGKTNIIGHTKYIIYFGYVLFYFYFSWARVTHVTRWLVGTLKSTMRHESIFNFSKQNNFEVDH